MVTKICRVCGKEYPACRDARRNPSGTFRWQEVACSKECGSIYLNQIMESRAQSIISSRNSTLVEDDVETIVSTPEVTEDEEYLEDDYEEIEDIGDIDEEDYE